MNGQKVKPLSVLHYEDKIETYGNSFRAAAQRRRILSECVDNVDDLIERLEASPYKYHFVVLDAKGYSYEGQAPGTESEVNLFRAFREIDRIELKYQVKLPRCILTGFADLKLQMEHNKKAVDCEIFNKGDEELVFQHIWKEYENSDEALIDSKYPEIFSFVCKHFPEPDRALMYEFFKKDKFTSVRIEDRISNLAVLRRTIETLMDIVHEKYLGGYPYFKPATRAGDICQHLNEQEKIPVHILSSLTTIRKTANNYGSHTPETAQKIDDYPSGAFISGFVSQFPDVFRWANSIIN